MVHYIPGYLMYSYLILIDKKFKMIMYVKRGLTMVT